MADMYFQYGVVALIFLGAVIWTIRKLFFKKPDQSSGCAGCAISKNCARKPLKTKSHKKCEESPKSKV